MIGIPNHVDNELRCGRTNAVATVSSRLTQQAIEANLTKTAEKVRSTDKPTFRDRFCKELDSYLDEPNAREISNPLIWWRTNQSKYPSLAAVARADLIGYPIMQLLLLVNEYFQNVDASARKDARCLVRNIIMWSNWYF
jgi:hAT family C-terminal dimerisation region